MKRKLMQLLVCLGIILSFTAAHANLDDTRSTIEAKYGPARLVIDADNQLWTNEDWLKKGQYRTKAASYMHSFIRQGLQIQMEVVYDTDKPDSTVRAQRFTPGMAIPVKEFRTYFPELITLIDHPQAVCFATEKSITRQFQEDQSPITLGLTVRKAPHAKRGHWYTLMVFNVQDEGRPLKDMQYISGEIYIREFTIEPVLATSATDSLDFAQEWKMIKKYF